MGIETSDLYEASFYLVNGCALTAITAHPTGGAIRCRMTFTGAGIEALQVTYLHGHAAANLFAFRRAYAELASALGRAKKQAKAASRGGVG